MFVASRSIENPYHPEGQRDVVTDLTLRETGGEDL